MAAGDQGCVGSLTLPECKAVPLDPRVKRFLDVLAAGKPPNAQRMTVQERRRSLAELLKLAGPQVQVGGIEERTLPGPGAAPLAVRIYTPLDGGDGMLPGLVYFHGGGFVAGNLATHDSIARALVL